MTKINQFRPCPRGRLDPAMLFIGGNILTVQPVNDLQDES
jgi:hypothetical protein